MGRTRVAPLVNGFSNFSTIFHFNSNIREAVNQSQPVKSLVLFRQLKQCGIHPDNLTFPFVAKACGVLSDLKQSQNVHSHVAKSPFQSDKYVQTALVDMYIKCGHLDYAYDLFEEMPKRDLTAWNAMLLGSVQMDFMDRARDVFDSMRIEGVSLDSVTVIGLSQLVCGMKDPKLVKAVHCLGIRIGAEADVCVINTWISSYAKCGDLSSAVMMFNCINVCFMTTVSWNSMIAGCANFNESSTAIAYYKQMLYSDFRPDLSTIVNLISSCAQPDAILSGKLIHSHGIQFGCDLDISVRNTLISMYSKCGDIHSARFVFDGMMDRTCVSWTAIIGGYAERGDLTEMLAMFHSMEAQGVSPDLVTILNVVAGCGQTGSLEIGRWIHSYIISNGMSDNVMLSNALIDMYAKCGSLREALELFSTMKKKTVVSWTSMIVGFALNGEFREALEHFFLMLQLGLKPNNVTFLAVLQACAHAGFYEKGRQFFHLMTGVYRINPGLDHYSCLVNLMGRVGKLGEALELIKNMIVKPDAGIWGTLLDACKIHKNVEIGEYAASWLFKLEPETAAPYVEMANIYASVGRWEGVAATRAKMKYNQVTKFPGKSIVHVTGISHVFTVEDKCHPESCVIYEALDNLYMQMKKLDLSCLKSVSFDSGMHTMDG